MQVHEALDDLIGGKTSIRVLRTLSLFPDKEFTGRELAGCAGGSPSKVIQELNKLRAMGVVSRKTMGRNHVWRVNRDHAVIRMMKPVFEEEQRLPDLLIESLREGTQDRRITRVLLFGSFARGDERPQSDADLLVVARQERDLERVRELVDDLAARLSKVFGLRLSPIVHVEQELPRLLRKPLFAQIKEDGRLLRGEAL